jgi:hypothetical protein
MVQNYLDACVKQSLGSDNCEPFFIPTDWRVVPSKGGLVPHMAGCPASQAYPHETHSGTPNCSANQQHMKHPKKCPLGDNASLIVSGRGSGLP